MPNPLSRLIKISILAMLTHITPCFPNTVDVIQAFKTLIAFSKPGIYQAQARGYMTGGSLSVSFPSKTVQLIDISPPHYSAGCSGIDLYAGGLSYISGQQFIELLKGIASNTMGYSFSLAMRTLCPVCASVIGSLQKVAQSANQLAIHQCQFAMGLSNPHNALESESRSTLMAALHHTNHGKVADFIAGINEIGDNVAKSIDALAGSLQKIEQQGTLNQSIQSTQYGSATWKLLNGLEFAQKVFIQSLTGSITRYPYPDKHPNTIVVRPVSASLSIEQLTNLFIYGADALQPNNSNLLLNSCLNKTEQGNFLSPKGRNLCERIVKTPIKQSKWYHDNQAAVCGISLKAYGFFGVTYGLLLQALQNIRDNQPLGTPQSVALPSQIYGSNVLLHTTFSQKEIEAFISIVPLPIYRAINIAATHPDVALALINNISEIVAMHYTIAFINTKILDISQADNTSSGYVGLSEKRLKKLEAMLYTMQAKLHTQAKAVLNHINATQSWVNQVNRIQSQLYTQTLVSKLMTGETE